MASDDVTRIDRHSAQRIARAVRAVERTRPELVNGGRSGNLYRANPTQQRLAKVTEESEDGNGAYTIQFVGLDEEADADAPITTSNLTIFNTVSAYEINGTTGITADGTVLVHAYLFFQSDGTGVWLFDAGGNVSVRYSIERDEDSGAVQLVNDEETPASWVWYGLNDGSERGYKASQTIDVVTEVGYDESTNSFTRTKATIRVFEAGDAGNAESFAEDPTDVIDEAPAPYVACSDGTTVVARFNVADLPAHEYAWVYDGSAYVKAYRLPPESGTATSPVPCVVLESSDPGSCAALDLSAFSDSFSDSSFDTCRNTEYTGGNGSTSEGGSGLVCTAPANDTGNNAGGFYSRAPVGSGDDFDITWTYSGYSYKNNSASDQNEIRVIVLGTGINFQFWTGSDGTGAAVGDGQIYLDGSSWVRHSTSTPSSGTFRLTRVGTTITGYIDGTQVFSVTGSTNALSTIWMLFNSNNNNASPDTATLTGITYA